MSLRMKLVETSKKVVAEFLVETNTSLGELYDQVVAEFGEEQGLEILNNLTMENLLAARASDEAPVERKGKGQRKKKKSKRSPGAARRRDPISSVEAYERLKSWAEDIQPGSSFKMGEIVKHTGLPATVVRRFVEDVFEKEGKGRGTYYTIPNPDGDEGSFRGRVLYEDEDVDEDEDDFDEEAAGAA